MLIKIYKKNDIKKSSISSIFSNEQTERKRSKAGYDLLMKKFDGLIKRFRDIMMEIVKTKKSMG